MSNFTVQGREFETPGDGIIGTLLNTSDALNNAGDYGLTPQSNLNPVGTMPPLSSSNGMDPNGPSFVGETINAPVGYRTFSSGDGTATSCMTQAELNNLLGNTAPPNLIGLPCDNPCGCDDGTSVATGGTSTASVIAGTIVAAGTAAASSAASGSASSFTSAFGAGAAAGAVIGGASATGD